MTINEAELPRYDLVETQHGSGYMATWDKSMELDADGEWCKYADVAALKSATPAQPIAVSAPSDERAALGEMEHQAEDADAAHMNLDDTGVPRSDKGDKVYSLWGRICQLTESLRSDAERFQWLCADHDDVAAMEKCRELLKRMPVMSYSAASRDIDLARAAAPVSGQGKLPPLPRAWHSYQASSDSEYASNWKSAYTEDQMTAYGQLCIDSRARSSEVSGQGDAARYQLLRRKVCIAGGKFHILNLAPIYLASHAEIELDAAIDAQILANKE